MSEQRVYIGIGSNIDPEHNIPRALMLLAEQVNIVAVSTLYRSAALNRPEQPPFVNGVCRIETKLPPHVLKSTVLRNIETELGRVRSGDRYAAREIDLDILLYGDLVINEQNLVIPDPDIEQRPFLAVPLLELEPNLILPGTHQPLFDCKAATLRETLTPEPGLTAAVRTRLAL